jgi:1-deoxy-D-xylulose-5-phosphate reductoisomerase
MKSLSLLGSTGSIGKNVLQVVRSFPDRFRVVGLAAGKNVTELVAQILEFQPECVSVAQASTAEQVQGLLPPFWKKKILWGDEGSQEVASLPAADMVISAMVGSVGLLPTLAAIHAGKDIGLANKETLVMAGRLVMQAVREHGVSLLPIDSEHSAIFQALEAGRHRDVARLILTASGGPFRSLPSAALAQVSPAQALNHPNWDMGRKISIDSATLMNKGLEVIEARWLFDIPGEHIRVLVHPESIVHSLVEYIDGSVVAQLGLPDMRIPIAYALSYPERLPLGLSRLSLSACGSLHFEKPDYQRFPALGLAFAALREGGIKPAVLNAANELAVAAFLEQQISFTDITQVVETVLEGFAPGDDLDLASILAADQQAREQAQNILDKIRTN